MLKYLLLLRRMVVLTSFVKNFPAHGLPRLSLFLDGRLSGWETPPSSINQDRGQLPFTHVKWDDVIKGEGASHVK
jgi:hypothetical protein